MVTRFQLFESDPRPTQGAEDGSLGRALLAGDERAPLVAWRRYSPLVRRILRRCLGPDQAVEDLVQEVFLKLFSRVHKLREPRALSAFVISVTTLTVRQELRRRRARSWLGFSSDEAVLDLRVVHPDPMARQALNRLYELLSRFGARDRTAFVLRCVEGMSLQEASDALGVSLATTKRSVAHVRRRLAERVRQDPLLSEYAGTVGKEP